MKKKVMLILSCLLLSVGFITAQTTRISGVVVDNAGEPVISASVVVKGTTIGTITDLDGKFTINVPDERKTLVFTLVGLRTLEMRASQNMQVVMETDETLLEEVMVVAYGVAKKESFTGSASVVDSKKIEKRVIGNITKAIDGLASGVLTTSGGGQPGSSASIRIRGFGSINASQDPLYVVDGIPYDGAMSALNPNDIESMTILKDASAAALYGARGANGVIIVTTKKGQTDKTKVNFKANVGWASRGIKEYDLVGQKDYVQLTYEALRNGYAFNSGYSWSDAEAQARAELGSKLGGETYNPFKGYTWDNVIDPATGKVQANAVAAWNESWMDAIKKDNALRNEYLLTLTGGNSKTKTLLSLGYLSEDGVLKTTSFERYSGRLSVDYDASDWFKTGLSSAFSSTNQNYSMYTGSSNANTWYSAQFMGPIYPVYMKDANGKDLLDESGQRKLDYGTGRPKLGNFSSIGTLYDDKADTKSENFSGRTYITIGSDKESAGWLRGLKLSANLGVDYRSSNVMSYYNMYHGNFSNMGGLLSKSNNRTFSYTFNQLLTYNKNIGNHNLDFLVGHEAYAYKYNYLYASKSGLIDGIYELAPATVVKDADSYEHNYKIESYLSRLNYNYADKYYLSLSFRTDGSSRFQKDNRWGNFWSVGGNWRVSQENFMAQHSSWLENLSVKASYGVQGNDNILDSNDDSNYYLWQSFYDLTYPNALFAGARITSLENKNISWEESRNLNVGFDARILKRFDIGVEYYNKKTVDMLLSSPMALSTGFSGYSANVGDMTNSGFDITLSALLVNNPNFSWRTTLMGSTVKNKVNKLTTEANTITSGNQVIEVGKELYTFYMPKSAGVDPATGAQLYWVYDKDEEGNITNEHISSDISKAANSKYYLGSRIPDLYGSISMDFTILKNFDLSFMTTYSIGGKVYDAVYAGAVEAMYYGDTWSTHALRRWQQPGDITDVPRVQVGSSNLTTDRYLLDASYFSIKNITFGYRVPTSFLKKAGMQSLRVSCTLDNLVTFTHLNGMDPQYNFRGTTGYTYAPNRTISLGLDINF